MIEVPRGAVTADEIAEEAEFFSFGTNDLTQMGCGFSRDDAGKFLERLRQAWASTITTRSRPSTATAWASWSRSPSQKGRTTRPDIKLGICGEHGGDPMSVEFCHMVG